MVHDPLRSRPEMPPKFFPKKNILQVFFPKKNILQIVLAHFCGPSDTLTSKLRSQASMVNLATYYKLKTTTYITYSMINKINIMM